VRDVFRAQRSGSEAAAQQAGRGRSSGREAEDGVKVENRRARTMEGIEEQRAFYTRAKPRGSQTPIGRG
jgi:hypothetical protein